MIHSVRRKISSPILVASTYGKSWRQRWPIVAFYWQRKVEFVLRKRGE
jgi:hypothetical protein